MVVLAITLGLGSPSGYVWFGILGAAAASVVVYVIGFGAGRVQRTGTCSPAWPSPPCWARSPPRLLFIDQQGFDQFRFWAVGSLAGRNAMALGKTTGRALGVRTGQVRVLTAAGPIWCVGLTVPHVARMIVGPDQRWVLSYSLLLAPILLISADVVGRVIARPGELEVGIVTAFLGVPVFLALLRRKRVAATCCARRRTGGRSAGKPDPRWCARCWRRRCSEVRETLERDIKKFRRKFRPIGWVRTVPDGSYLITDKTSRIDYSTGAVRSADTLMPGHLWKIQNWGYCELTLTVNAERKVVYRQNSRTYPGDAAGWCRA